MIHIIHFRGQQSSPLQAATEMNLENLSFQDMNKEKALNQEVLEKGAEPEKMDVIIEHLKDENVNHFKPAIEEHLDRRTLIKHFENKPDIVASHSEKHKEGREVRHQVDMKNHHGSQQVEQEKEAEHLINTPTGIDGLHTLDNQLRHILRSSSNHITTEHLIPVKKLDSPQESPGRKLPSIPPVANRVGFVNMEDVKQQEDEGIEQKTLEQVTADQKSPDDDGKENKIQIDDEVHVDEMRGPQISIPDTVPEAGTADADVNDQKDGNADDEIVHNDYCDRDDGGTKNVEFTTRTDYAIEEDAPTNIYADEIATRAAPFTMFSQFNMSMMPSSEENSEQSDRWETPAAVRPQALNIKMDDQLDIGVEYLTPPENMPNYSITPMKGERMTPIIKGGSLREVMKRENKHKDEVLRTSSLREDVVKNVKEAVFNIGRILPTVEGVTRRFSKQSEDSIKQEVGEQIENKVDKDRKVVESPTEEVTPVKSKSEAIHVNSVKQSETETSPVSIRRKNNTDFESIDRKINMQVVTDVTKKCETDTSPDSIRKNGNVESTVESVWKKSNESEDKIKTTEPKSSGSSRENSSVFSAMKRFPSPYKKHPRKPVKDYSLKKEILELDGNSVTHKEHNQKESRDVLLEERGSADGASPRTLEDPKTHDSLRKVANSLAQLEQLNYVPNTAVYQDEENVLHQRRHTTGPSYDALEHLYDNTDSILNRESVLRGSIDTMWSAIETESTSSLPRPPNAMKTRKAVASSNVRYEIFQLRLFPLMAVNNKYIFFI